MLKGEKALQDLLEAFKACEPPFLISSPVLEKNDILFYPMPQMQDNFQDPLTEDPTKLKEFYSLQKEVKKLKYLPEEIFMKFLEGKLCFKRQLLEEDTVGKAINEFLKEVKSVSISLEVSPHNFINRISWSTSSGGRLYNLAQFWYPTFSVFLKIYNRDLLDVELFKGIFELISLGGKKSWGFGRVKVLEIKEAPSYIKKHFEGNFESHKIVTLSPTSMDKSFNLDGSFYELKILLGRVENYFGRLTKPILKRRIAVFMPGSLLVLKEGKKKFYGGLKPGVEKIFYYAYAFPLYIKT